MADTLLSPLAHMVGGVLTSSIEQRWCKLFFGMQALPKNRGAYVDNQLWLTSDTFEYDWVIQKDSIEKVVNMRVLCIFKMNNFIFGVILIRVSMRSTKPRQGVQTEDIQHEYCTGQIRRRLKTGSDGPWDDLGWKGGQHESSSSFWDEQLYFWNYLNPS